MQAISADAGNLVEAAAISPYPFMWYLVSALYPVNNDSVVCPKLEHLCLEGYGVAKCNFEIQAAFLVNCLVNRKRALSAEWALCSVHLNLVWEDVEEVEAMKAYWTDMLRPMVTEPTPLLVRHPATPLH